jgi:hypothetical protein
MNSVHLDGCVVWCPGSVYTVTIVPDRTEFVRSVLIEVKDHSVIVMLRQQWGLNMKKATASLIESRTVSTMDCFQKLRLLLSASFVIDHGQLDTVPVWRLVRSPRGMHRCFVHEVDLRSKPRLLIDTVIDNMQALNSQSCLRSLYSTLCRFE